MCHKNLPETFDDENCVGGLVYVLGSFVSQYYVRFEMEKRDIASGVLYKGTTVSPCSCVLENCCVPRARGNEFWE
jgi:hypothetical protein